MSTSKAPVPVTDEALRLLLDNNEYWARTGESSTMRRTYRLRLNEGGLSQEKKEALLLKAGFTVATQKLWSVPAIPSDWKPAQPSRRRTSQAS